MKFSPLLDDLIRELQVLPGVGPKSAQRMAFQLLERERSRGQKLAIASSVVLSPKTSCASCAPTPSVPKNASCVWSNRPLTSRPWSRPISIPAATLC